MSHENIINLYNVLNFLDLFYYYEAMLTAAKNLNPVFTEFETIISKNYALGWIDFNTSVFIRYFFQTEFVQNKVYGSLEVRESTL